jgi:hypothetical protein
MTFNELKSQIDQLDQKQLNQEVYIRFIDNKLNFQFIQLISIKHSGKEKDSINWAWLLAEKLPTKQKYQFNNL